MTKITLEKLALMIQAGFDTVDVRMTALENTQSDMLLKMDVFAYKIDVVDLKQEVVKLENKQKL